MRKCLMVAPLVAVCLAAPFERAQSQNFDAWLALMSTPAGALPPVAIDPTFGADQSAVWILRAASWKFNGSDDRNYTYGLSVVAPVGSRVLIGGTIAYVKAGGGGDGIEMAGVDVQASLWKSNTSNAPGWTLQTSVKGSVGFGHDDGDVGQNASTLVGSIPISARFRFAGGTALTLAAEPGVGFGRISGGSAGVDNGSGHRPTLGFGAGLNTASGFGVQAGIQKVFLDTGSSSSGPPWNVGLSVSFASKR